MEIFSFCFVPFPFLIILLTSLLPLANSYHHILPTPHPFLAPIPYAPFFSIKAANSTPHYRNVSPIQTRTKNQTNPPKIQCQSAIDGGNPNTPQEGSSEGRSGFMVCFYNYLYLSSFFMKRVTGPDFASSAC